MIGSMFCGQEAIFFLFWIVVLDVLAVLAGSGATDHLSCRPCGRITSVYMYIGACCYYSMMCLLHGHERFAIMAPSVYIRVCSTLL